MRFHNDKIKTNEYYLHRTNTVGGIEEVPVFMMVLYIALFVYVCDTTRQKKKKKNGAVLALI